MDDFLLHSGDGDWVYPGCYRTIKPGHLCVSEELFARLKEEYNLDEKDKNKCGFYHISDIIEVIPNPKDEFTCEEIEGYQVEELKRILEFKKKRNAPKDQPYIEKITKYLEEHKN